MLPWPRKDNCNANNPAGIAELDNGTLLMCIEATIAHSKGAGQGTHKVLAQGPGPIHGSQALIQITSYS